MNAKFDDIYNSYWDLLRRIANKQLYDVLN